MAFESKTATLVRGIPSWGKEQKVERKANALLGSLLLKTMKENLKEEEFSSPVTPLAMGAKAEKQENPGKDRDLGNDRIMGNASSSREGVVLLQWGHRKRPRCGRAVDNHLKHNSLTDESSVLSRKMVRVKAEKLLLVTGTAHRRALKVKNGMPAGQDPPRLPNSHVEVNAGAAEEGRKRSKVLGGGGASSQLGKMNRGTPLEGMKGVCSLAPSYKKNTSLQHHSKTRASPERNKASPDRSFVANGGNGSIQITAAKIDFDWPKIFISLSRKEKEDDFLILKGTKLPQRPKRRPKAVEKALHFCTPGSWLTDISRGRYDVREKKCTKKKPRGLKAMESIDSDSE